MDTPTLKISSWDSSMACPTPVRNPTRYSPTHLRRLQLEKDLNFRPSSPTDEVFLSPRTALKKSFSRNDTKSN